MLDAPTTEAIGSGLSDQEAVSRLKAEDPNELVHIGRRTPFRIAFEVRRPLPTILALEFLNPHFPKRLMA